MKRLPWLGGVQLKLSTRLTLLNVMICLGIGLIIAIQFVSYYKVDDLLSEISHDHMDQVIGNAQNGRDLSKIVAAINLLTHHFYGQDHELKLMSGRILSDMALLRDTNRDPVINRSLDAFTVSLRTFIDHCRKVNGFLSERKTIDQELHNRLNALEKIVADHMIELTLAGEETAFIEQLSLLIFGYRESLLDIGKYFAELDLTHFTDPFSGPRRPILGMLKDFKLRLRTLTASDEAVQALAMELNRGVERYATTMEALYAAMLSLRDARQNMRESQGRLITTMANADNRLAESAEQVDRVIKHQLQRTAFMVGALALAILVGLVVASSILLIKHVRSPMQAIQAGISGFSKGHLASPIDLKRQDEWGVIENALNRMARDLKASYTALEISEKSYRGIFENVNEGIYQTVTTDSGSYFSKANPALARLLGYESPQEVIQAYDDLGTQLFVDPKVRERLISTLRRQKTVNGFECQLKDRSGKHLWVAISAHLSSDDGKRGNTLEGTMLDISDRKMAEDALRESEDRYRTLVHASPSPIIVHQDDRVVFANEAAAACLQAKGVTALLNREVKDFVHPDDLGIVRERIAKMYSREEGDNTPLPVIEERFITLEGNTIDVLVAAVGTSYEGQKATQVVFQDITVRKRAEKEMHRLRKLLRNITDSMPSALVAVDAKSCVTHWNREAEHLTGTPSAEAQGRPLTEVFPLLKDQEPRIMDAIAQQPYEPLATVTDQLDDKEVINDITIYPLTSSGMAGAVIRLDDVTDRVRMKEMMIQSEKMLSVGGLAAGMAHEINNPLAGILQNVQVIENRLLKELPKNQRAAAYCGIEFTALGRYLEERGIPEMLTAVNDSGRRAARIVENMLSFARKGESVRSSNDLAALMDTTIELAQNDYDLTKKLDFRHIRLVKEYDESLPPIACNSSKIQQVLLNLLRNGAQALAAAGKMKPHQGEQAADAPQITLRIQGAGEMARIEIEDNGPGMDEETRKRVFEPFFTTKAVGVGTGLGLSVSYFIITENHKGRMSVTSQVGKGSTFRIELPMKPS